MSEQLERPEKPEHVYTDTITLTNGTSVRAYRFEDGRAATEEDYVAALRGFVAWLEWPGDEADAEEK